MTVMTVSASGFLPRGRALTRADLAATPDDGHRYELIDGALVVTPAPRVQHQVVLFRLARILDDVCPPEFAVLVAPVDVVLADDTVIQPDVLVAPRDAFTETELPGPPKLAVEVLSPSTRGMDLLLKKDRLERAGCADYWVIDSETPSILAWRLVDGAYQVVARASGDQKVELDTPFPVAFVPSGLSA